jgi:hypothetical protein
VLWRVFIRLHTQFKNELLYRMVEQPREQRPKKRREKIADWKTAAEYLKTGTKHFFSAGFVEQAMRQAAEPDLRVDFEKLPRPAQAEMPVMWMSDAQVVTAFINFLTEAEPGSFEREDAEAMLRQLRAMLARARGQHGTAEARIRREDE